MIYDVTYPVFPGMTVYPGDPGVEFDPVLSLAKDGVAVNSIKMGTHTGTHVDAPGHFISGGKTVDQLDTGTLTGKALVYGLTGIKRITPEHLAGVKPGRVIFKTGYLLWDNQNDHPFVTPEASGYLVSLGVTLLGVDFPSVDSPGESQSHKILLGAGLVLVENLMLKDVPPGSYNLICLPLPLQGMDGSPARVLLESYDNV